MILVMAAIVSVYLFCYFVNSVDPYQVSAASGFGFARIL
jgi:hypothetical protein